MRTFFFITNKNVSISSDSIKILQSDSETPSILTESEEIEEKVYKFLKKEKIVF